MTTLAANKERRYSITYDDFNELPAIGSDILYQGSAMGAVDGTGYIRPLTSVDRFVGFGDAKADNNTGSSGDINVNLRKRGRIQLTITGVLITDVGQPVYATDDDTFAMSPVGGVFIGFVHRWVSSGVAIVEFDAPAYRDPYGRWSIREALTSTKTFDAEDCGKLFWCTGDATALTLPAIATGLSGLAIVSGGGFGTQATTIDPAAADMILGPDITGADNKDLINTKATQRRGDYVVLIAGDADGYMVTEMRGTWAREA